MLNVVLIIAQPLKHSLKAYVLVSIELKGRLLTLEFKFEVRPKPVRFGLVS